MFVVEAEDSLHGQGLSEKQREIAQKKLEKLENNSDKTGGLQSKLHLALNAKVMIVRNINMSLGLPNGRIGYISKINFSGSTVKSVTIKLDDSENVEHEIERINAKFEIGKGIYVVRSQFPLKLAYAITIHKSQGKTFESATVDCGVKLFAPGQSYVAVSRLKTLNGINFTKFDENSIVVNKPALIEYNRLREKFRPDLPQYDILKETKKRKYQKLSGTYEDSDCHEPVNKIRKKNDLQHSFVKGFTNPDAISCYSNASIQCLLRAEDFVHSIEMSAIDNNLITPFKNIIVNSRSNDYTMHLETVILRFGMASLSPSNQVFIGPNQQDASEFITHLFDTLDECGVSVEEHIGYSEQYELKCSSCNVTTPTGNDQHMYSLSLCFSSQDSIRTSFKELLKTDPVDAYCCSQCGNICNQEKILKIRDPKKYLILEIKRFTITEGRTVKNHSEITGFNYADIRIKGFRYKLLSAIAHHGNESNSGHYITYIRSQQG